MAKGRRGKYADVSEEYIPTLEEIHAATAEIRARWSEREHRRRAGYLPQPFFIDEVKDNVFQIDRKRRAS